MKKSVFVTVIAAVAGVLSMAGWSLAERASAYMSLDRAAKLERLWKQVQNTSYRAGDLPVSDLNGWSLAAGVMPWFLHKTFTHDSDRMPVGRAKVVHPTGTVARIRWLIDEPALATGVFAESTVGLARLSVATDTGPFAPGIAVKLPIDSNPSINFVATYSLDGQKEKNFFANPFSTSIPKPRGLALKAGQFAFRLAIRTLKNAPESELHLPNIEAASIRPDGSRAPEIADPREVVFRPTAEAVALTRPLEEKDFRVALSAIPSGSTIYTIHARMSESGSLVRIGRLITESGFIASEFGDKKLFFQHQRRVVR